MLRLPKLVCVAVAAASFASTASAQAATNVYCQNDGPVNRPKRCDFTSNPMVSGTYVTGIKWRG